jgi:hypothetical protein
MEYRYVPHCTKPVPDWLDKKKAEENATFCLKRDANFSPLFLSNEPGTGIRGTIMSEHCLIRKVAADRLPSSVSGHLVGEAQP